jgi:hypothetical protein
MNKPLAVGMLVAVPSVGLIGKVAKIDPHCADGKPCPCCGRGVSVSTGGDGSFGVAPADCFEVVPGALFFSSGCDDLPPMTVSFPSRGGVA